MLAAIQPSVLASSVMCAVKAAKPQAASRNQEISERALAAITSLGAVLSLMGAVVFDAPILILASTILALASFILFLSASRHEGHIYDDVSYGPNVVVVDRGRRHSWGSSFFSHNPFSFGRTWLRPRPTPIIVDSGNRQVVGRVNNTFRQTNHGNVSAPRQVVGTSHFTPARPVNVSSVRGSTMHRGSVSSGRVPLGRR